jgi:hypothetical protein
VELRHGVAADHGAERRGESVEQLARLGLVQDEDDPAPLEVDVEGDRAAGVGIDSTRTAM